ncbi:unnamed protein product, partial [marine sediment metagenome]
MRLLRDTDPERLGFMRHLMQSTGLVHVTRAGLLRPDPGLATDWLRSPTQQQRTKLAQAWRDDPTWNDLIHVPSLRLEDTGGWRNDPVLARQAVLSHLPACSSGAWYAIEGFAAAIKRRDADFQRPDGDYTAWYIRDSLTGVYLSGFENWEAVEGALIRYLIVGPLAWLGLVDLGMASVDGPLVAFRLTTPGEAFLGLRTLRPEPEPVPLTLRPGPVVAVPQARRYDRFQLARIASRVRSD